MSNNTDLDARVRHIVRHHFHPDQGAPFWRKLASKLSFDPITDIQGRDDLWLFAADDAYDRFPAEQMRHNPHEFIPESWTPTAYRLWSTGGRTGDAKWTAWLDDDLFEQTVRQLTDLLTRYGVSPGRKILHVGPTDPTVFGTVISEVARRQNANAITVGLDSQWAATTQNDPRLQSKGIHDAYKDHLAEKAMTHLRQFADDVGVFVSSPVLLDDLLSRSFFEEISLDLVVFGGQELDAEDYQYYREEMPVDIVGEYGNTLFGIAPQIRFDDTDQELVYQPTYRQGYYDVMVPEKLEDGEYEQVSYGERGIVVAHIIREGLFAPFHVETDYATRHEPGDRAVIDALGNPSSSVSYGDSTDDVY